MTDFVSGAILSAAALDAAFNQLTINAQTGTAYTLVFTDQGGMVTVTNAAANTVSVPLNATAAFPIGTAIVVASLGAGQCTIVAVSGVTVNATPGLKVRAQFSAATLIKTATNVWLAVGDLSA